MARFLKNTDPRFHLLETRSRWFGGLIVVIMVAVVSLAVWQQEWLRGGKRVTMISATSEGLTVGMAVRLSGFRIGKVQAVELQAPGCVQVTALIFHEYASYVRRDSKALVRGENIIGDRFIELGVGSAGAPEIGAGESLELQAEPTIGAMVDAFRKEVRPVIDELAAVAHYLNDPEGDLKSSVRNIRGITAAFEKEAGPTLQSSRETADRLKQLAGDLTNPDGSLMTSLDHFNRATRTLDEDLPSLSDKLDVVLAKFDSAGESATKMFDHLDRTVGKLEKMVDQAAPEVPGMVKSGAKTVKKAEDVVSSVRNMWPLKGGMSKEREEVLKRGSDE